MKNYIHILFLGLIFAFSSCEKLVMEPNPETSNTAIFNEYATLVKEKYAMLDFKGVDIQHLQDSIGATINETTTELELFDKLAIITLRLRDGHSSLISNNNNVSYDFISDYPAGFDVKILADKYTGKDVNPDLKVLEGFRAIYG